jgi:hypothetical protein
MSLESHLLCYRLGRWHNRCYDNKAVKVRIKARTPAGGVHIIHTINSPQHVSKPLCAWTFWRVRGRTPKPPPSTPAPWLCIGLSKGFVGPKMFSGACAPAPSGACPKWARDHKWLSVSFSGVYEGLPLSASNLWFKLNYKKSWLYQL